MNGQIIESVRTWSITNWRWYDVAKQVRDMWSSPFARDQPSEQVSPFPCIEWKVIGVKGVWFDVKWHIGLALLCFCQKFSFNAHWQRRCVDNIGLYGSERNLADGSRRVELAAVWGTFMELVKKKVLPESRWTIRVCFVAVSNVPD